MAFRNDLIAIREFDGSDGVIDEGGTPQRERVVYLYPRKTVGMQRRTKNALVHWNGGGDTEVRLGDNQVARWVAAIHSWEGPGLDGRALTIEGVDDLEFDSFLERVFDEIDERFGDKPQREAEAAGKPTLPGPPMNGNASSSERAKNLWASGTSTSPSSNGITGHLINVTN